MTEYPKLSAALVFVSVASVWAGGARAATGVVEPVQQRVDVPASAVADAVQERLEREADYLNIDRQRGLRARQYDIAPDVRKFEQMQLDRRLELQRYERLQAQRDYDLRRAGSLPPELLEQRTALQQQIRAQERQLQYQRFEMDRERQLQLLDRGPFLPPITGTPPPREP